MKLTPMLRVLIVLTLILGGADFLSAQIIQRETADPLDTGTAAWIKVVFDVAGGKNTYLDDDFTGTEFRVDLDLDGDHNPSTNPGDVYILKGAGNIFTTPTGVPGGNNDDTIYLPIRQGTTPTPYPYDTSLRPWIWMVEGGGLEISGLGPNGPWGSIQYSSGYIQCEDGITPTIRKAYYYDDGSGPHSTNNKAFDGLIDRIDLIWSEPMDQSVTTVNTGIFGGLVGSTISSLETTGAWKETSSPYKRFTLWVRSSAPNSGINLTLAYTRPSGAYRQSTSAPDPYAHSHSISVVDKAGPAIISAKTLRYPRRQPLAQALTDKLIEVTFSEPLNRTNVQTSDFIVITSATDPSQNPILSIQAPGTSDPATAVYRFKLTTNFASGNETGTIQYAAYHMVTDVPGNYNGESLAATPPTAPANSSGASVTIVDGINPIITEIRTLDAVLPMDLAGGGTNGWGYLDYLLVIFDHAMNTSYVGTSGMHVYDAEGELSIFPTAGTWVSSDTFRVNLTWPTGRSKVPNTGLIPKVSYTQASGVLREVSGGMVDDLYVDDAKLAAPYNVKIFDTAGPAIWKAVTAGEKRIQIFFSEKVNSAGWPTTPTAGLPSPLFKWFVASSKYNLSMIQIHFTGIQDSIVYLNHSGLKWTKNDVGAINYFAGGTVFDLASAPGPNSNDQYDNDGSIDFTTPQKMGSDVEIEADKYPPLLMRLETVDIDADGKLDHYRLSFDDLSPIFPRRSFKAANWSITGYDGLKNGLALNMLVYNPSSMVYQADALRNGGVDTVAAYVSFNETVGTGPALTPYGGDTGDVPDVVVALNKGFTDWADNAMDPLPAGLTVETDDAGPAIMSANTISRFDVEAFMSEDLANWSVNSRDFFLNMANNANYFGAWPIREANEVSPGKVLINTLFYTSSLGWDPRSTGALRFDEMEVVEDLVSPVSNGNVQTDWIAVTSKTACRLVIAPVATGAQVRGVPFTVRVLALDPAGNVDPNFNSPLTFSANLQNSQIDMPSGLQKLVGGVGDFTFTSWVATTNLILSATVATDVYPLDSNSSSTITVIDPVIDMSNLVYVKDIPNDHGGWVTVSWPFSANHQGMGALPVINYYEIFYTVAGDGNIHYWPQQINAYNAAGTGATMMSVDIPVVSSAAITFYVRAVWVPPTASVAKGGATLAAVAEPQAVTSPLPMVFHSLKGESAVTSVLGAMGSAVVSGTAMGSGRAIDNIAPMAPALLAAEKEGAAVKLHWKKVLNGVDGSLERAEMISYRVYMHETDPYFNPDEAGMLLATTTDTTFMVNTDALCQYYVVRANDSDNKSALSRRVGKYGFNLVTGSKPRFNYLSLPLDTKISNARELAEAIGSGVKTVLQINHTTNGYSTYYLPELNYPATPFALKSGMPVLVQLDDKAPAQWFYCGTVPEATTLQFRLGTEHKYTYNEIMVPLNRKDITNASELAGQIGGVEVLLKVGADGHGFSQYWLPSLNFGNPMTPFSVTPGESVLIQVNKTAPALWPTYTR